MAKAFSFLCGLRGLTCGWSWEAYALSNAWLSSNQPQKCRQFIQDSPRLQDVVALGSRVTGTADAININAKAWPNITWASNFYVEYSGFLKVTMPGTLYLYMTSTNGAVGTTCSINGITITKSTLFSAGLMSGALTVVGTTVSRWLLYRKILCHSLGHSHVQRNWCCVIISLLNCGGMGLVCVG